jgi:membrane-associated phospholipid phosphatase
MNKLRILVMPVFWGPWFAAVALCYYYVDLPLTIFVSELVKEHTWLTKIFSKINQLGTSGVYFAPTILTFLWAYFIVKNKKIAWIMGYFLMALSMACIASVLLKICAGRARPCEFFEFHLYGFYFWQFNHNFASFPSGHATCTAAVAASLYLAIRRFGWFFLLLFFLVFIGRIVVLAHYLSDVMAGGYLGATVSYYVYGLFKHKLKFSQSRRLSQSTLVYPNQE